jgi:DsbC/DsbD-like thiol-disulfide interchange protein
MAWTMRQYGIRLTMAAMSLVLVSGTPLLANPVSTTHVQAELGSVVTTIQPGTSFWVVLHLRMPAGWHTYWQNPGDAGLATAIHWLLPAGFTAGDIVWPYPQRLPVGPLMNYGYEGAVSLLTQITAPADLLPGQHVALRAETTWVACAKLCVPEAATLELRLPVSIEKPQDDARWKAALTEVQPRLPSAAPWQVVFTEDQDTLTLVVAAPDIAASPITDVTFFPLAYGIIDHAAAQQFQMTEQGLRLMLRRGTLDPIGLTRIEGVLVLREQRDSASRVQAFTVSALPGKTL